MNFNNSFYFFDQNVKPKLFYDKNFTLRIQRILHLKMQGIALKYFKKQLLKLVRKSGCKSESRKFSFT